MHIHRTADQIAADRTRYEAHQRRGLESAPMALPDPSPRPAPEPAQVLSSEVIPFGWYSFLRLQAGEVLRLQMGGLGSSVSLACWSALDSTERLNLPDTVKVQWTTELRKGRVLFSDMGRVMLSFTEDSSGAHDALTGGSPGGGTPGQRNCRDNMILAAAKLGLDRRDLPALMTLFAPVRVDAAGRFGWRGSLLAGDDWLDLRAEMPLLIALSNTRHPLDSAEGEPALTLTRLAAAENPADDLCRTASAEAVRGFENTARM